MREELERRDVAALLTRAANDAACANQPTDDLVHLANGLMSLTGDQVVNSIADDVVWQIVDPESVTSRVGHDL